MVEMQGAGLGPAARNGMSLAELLYMELRTFISAGLFTTLICSASLLLASTQAQQAPSRPVTEQQKQPPPPPASVTKTTPTTAAGQEKIGTLDARSRRNLATQVALDRAGFSPGELDAASGNNTRRALQAFQKAQGLPATGQLDDRTITSLGDVFTYPVANYAISANDIAEPSTEPIPTDMMEKSKLPKLGYASIQELLAERFHMSPKLLQRLNPQAKFERGEVITVPNVELFIAPGLSASPAQTSAAAAQPDATPTGAAPTKTPDATPAAGSKPTAPDTKPTAPVAKPPAAGSKPASTAGNVITVSDKEKSLMVENASGETIFFAPVTVGSKNDPLPVGEWKVNGVSRNPTFNYNPDLFWDADPAHAKAKIPAGPNNPVGVVWIDLSKEHYGIHGTPEPSRIGYTESHGCIRLTNWDAMRVAALVAPGTKVVLR